MSLLFSLSDAAARAGSLAAKDHFLYAAVRGVILCLNCETMEVVHTFDMYYKAVRSLLVINYSSMQSKPFDRLLSRIDSKNSMKSSTSSYNSLSSLGRGSSSNDSLSHSRSLHSNDSFSNEDGSTNSVLVSFGVGYKGVVGDCLEHPENFILPSEGHRTNQQPARMQRALGCLLLWSTEVCNKKTVQSFPELEEEALPDDVVSSY